MTLGEFEDQVRASAKRGTALDAQLPGFIRRAARWIEQNYTLSYMRRRITLSVAVGEQQIPLPAGNFKELGPIVFAWSGGTSFVNKVDLESLTVSEQIVFPTQYAVQGASDLIFNMPFSEAAIGAMVLVQYSDWPLAPNQTHWLLNNAEQLMLVQTMLNIMVDLRNDQGYQAVMNSRNEAVKALLDADYATRYGGQTIYSGP